MTNHEENKFIRRVEPTSSEACITAAEIRLLKNCLGCGEPLHGDCGGVNPNQDKSKATLEGMTLRQEDIDAIDKIYFAPGTTRAEMMLRLAEYAGQVRDQALNEAAKTVRNSIENHCIGPVVANLIADDIRALKTK